ncbi:hypothetical protein Paes_0819 [Prosthecochloris aestuarii DSM 271]|uniref:Uncharacterized protein n=1 Tax=Prosthecochloris aestuarii (strain DSM 271 / SK 413) TaxID=290512 RepID=B4S728_PROA2|nr:hypothetical protein Paes_0819 [Prosthecochloris aestuarii DSM 271]
MHCVAEEFTVRYLLFVTSEEEITPSRNPSSPHNLPPLTIHLFM